MRVVLIAALALVASPATGDDGYGKIYEAHKRCMSAWFQATRVEALNDIRDGFSAMTRAGVEDDTLGVKAAAMKAAKQMHDECQKAVNG